MRVLGAEVFYGPLLFHPISFSLFFYSPLDSRYSRVLINRVETVAACSVKLASLSFPFLSTSANKMRWRSNRPLLYLLLWSMKVSDEWAWIFWLPISSFFLFASVVRGVIGSEASVLYCRRTSFFFAKREGILTALRYIPSLTNKTPENRKNTCESLEVLFFPISRIVIVFVVTTFQTVPA